MPAILVDDLMDTAQDVAAPTAVSAVADAGAGAATSSSASFTVLATDARGSLLAQQLPPSPPVPIAGASAEASGSAPAPRAGAEPRLVLRARGAGVAKGDLAVQKTATGSIGDLVQVVRTTESGRSLIWLAASGTGSLSRRVPVYPPGADEPALIPPLPLLDRLPLHAKPARSTLYSVTPATARVLSRS